jgi:hypothetical protein
VEPPYGIDRRPSPYDPKSPRFTTRQALPAGRQPALIWILPWPAASATAPAITPAAEQQLARGPCPASGSSHPRAACHSGPARGAACRPATSTPTVKRRSDDLSAPAHPRPGDHVEQAFPYRQAENLNQCPYLHPPMQSPCDKPRNLVDPKDTPRNTQETEPADLVTRAWPAAQSIRICRCA